MADDTNIKQFNATDIVKYHQGLLSSKEMHDLEKAALDDPFLADALEGYNSTGVNVVTDLNELKSQLNERTSSGKVVSINTNSHTTFAWWKVAAMIILIGGAGFLIYRFAFVNPWQNEVAKLQQENKAVSPLIKDSLEDKTSVITNENLNSNQGQDKTTTNSGTAMKQNGNSNATLAEMNKDYKTITTTDSLSSTAFNKDAGVQFSTAPPKQEAEKLQTTDIVKSDNKILNNKSKPDVEKIETSDESYKQKDGVINQNKDVALASKKSEPFRGNYFRGHVLDAENNPLPFANITNEADRVGTYADAKGYFTLTSSDSVMNVQIRSVGFENNSITLNSKVPNNQVVLQEDRNSLSEVVLSNNSPNTNRLQELKEANVKIEEPEPADGWFNYDVYLVNNLNIPEEKKINRRDGIVEITFDINKNGQPINFKVEKSLCKSCDDEAIRLVKEGPRWKKSKKNTRARVAVPFND